MPIHLPPISRRQFLKGSLASAAALALAPGCATSKSRPDEQTIALFSDIHIAGDPAKLGRGINMTDHLKVLVAEAAAWKQVPEVAFVNGDLAFNSGETADYQAVVGLLRPLREAGMPVHLNMGNHDDREHFWGVCADAKTVPAGLPGRQASIVRGGPVNWFLLDSLIKTLTTPGLVGPEQRAWLAAALDANTDKPAIVMVHHQVGALSPTHPGDGLEDGAEMMALLRPRRNVKAYLHGHTHRWNITQDESGLQMVNLPTTAYPFDPVMPSAWVHATMRSKGARLELRCVDHAHKNHGQVVELKWREA